MEITLNKADNVSAKLTVKITKADYQEKVDKALKNIKKKASMHGFRPGMVPMGLIQKFYGDATKADEVEKLVQEKLADYLRENKVNMLGDLLPDPEQKRVDFKEQDDFEFSFDVALAPEFKAELTGRDKIPYYDIEVSDDMVNDQVKAYAQRAGHYDKVEAYQKNDMLKGTLTELNADGSAKDDGLVVEGAVLMPDYFKDKDQEKLFETAKLGDIITFNPWKAYEGSEIEVGTLLKKKKEEATNYQGDFNYQIEEITRFTPAEIDQELFDKSLGKDAVKSEEEFRAKIKENLQQRYVADSDFKFLLDVRAHMEKKVGKLEWPDALLKRIMQQNNKDKDQKFIDENYDKSIAELEWHLIKEKLVSANDIKVNDDDLKAAARAATSYQFAQYGFGSLPDEVLEKYATEMLGNRDQVQQLVDRCVDQKLTAALKNVVKLDRHSVSIDDFNKMFEKK